MRTKTLKCDRCGNEETVPENTPDYNTTLKLLKVGTAVVDPNQTNIYYGLNVPQAWMQHSQEWCEKCRIELGLVWRSKEQQEEKPYSTLEEQLREIIRCIVQEEIPN